MIALYCILFVSCEEFIILFSVLVLLLVEILK